MAAEYSFDVVSRVDLNEVKNAIDQAEREIANRFDFRNTKTKFELEGNALKILSDDEFHLNMVLDILRSKFAKRNVSLKALEYGRIEAASGGTVRQTVTLRQGIPTDEAKALVKEIKASGIRAQAQIQGDQLRVSGRDKDALQAVQRLLRGMENLPYDVEFVNYR
jgi:uncharacterized protein YajQ (UPF0234 family)